MFPGRKEIVLMIATVYSVKEEVELLEGEREGLKYLFPVEGEGGSQGNRVRTQDGQDYL